MTRLFSLLIFLTLIVIAYMSLKPASEHSTRNITGLPWQIETLPDGSAKVFGVTLGHSNLGDAREQLGDDMELAIITSDQGSGLEMFYSRYTAGVFSGKLVLAADIEHDSLESLMERSVKSEYMESGARKFTLNPGDLTRALQAPVKTLTFIPSVSIDEQSAIKRFGPPAETLITSDQVTHLLYPDKGLDLIINRDGKEVLQYISPRDFAQLREPLLNASAFGNKGKQAE
jgi:hypothetical protein